MAASNALSRRPTPLFLAAVKLRNKWGFLRKDGAFAIGPQFSRVEDFKDGYALVTDQEHSYYIDAGGKVYVPTPPFKYQYPYQEGLARVLKDHKYGFVDRDDRCVIQPRYQRANDFTGGVAAVMDDGGWRFIDKSGDPVIPGYFHDEHAFDRDRGLVLVKHGELFGIQDLSRAWVIEPKFSQLKHFREGLAAAAIRADGRDVFGYVDVSGSFAIEPLYWEASSFFSGMACVREPDINNYRGSLLNRDGNRINREYCFADCTYLGDGIAIAVQWWNGFGPWTGGRYVVYGREGYIVPPFLEHDEAAWEAIDESPVADEYGTHLGLEDYRGRREGLEYELRLPGMSWVRTPSEGLMAYSHKFHSCRRSRAGFIDLRGDPVIPAVFEWAHPFSCGLAAVGCMGRKGYIDHQAQFVIDPGEFDEIRDFKAVLSSSSEPTTAIDRACGSLQVRTL